MKRHGMNTAVVNVSVHGDPAKLEEWAIVSPQVEFLQATKTGGRIEVEDWLPGNGGQRPAPHDLDGLVVIEFRREECNLEDAFIEMVGKLEKETAAR